MKKLFALAIVALMAVSASAQYYIGGGIGFGMDKTKPEGGESSTNTSFTIAPELGYNLDANSSLGIRIGFTSSKEDGIPETKTNNFIIEPYYRYYFFGFGNFRVAAEAGLNFNTGKTTWSTAGNPDIERKVTGFGLNVTPVLTYGLTDKVTLLAGLNFMGLGFNQEKIKDAGTTTEFGLGVDTNNVANTGDISIGFVYNF